MWTRQELKEKGKAAFKRNYWKSVVAGLVVLLTTGAAVSSGAGSTGGYAEFEADLNAALAQSGISPAVLIAVLFGVLGVACLISAALNAFLRNPIQVGTNRFFLKNAQEPAKLNELLYAFQSGHYLKIVGAKFLAGLFIALWSLLLVVPGVIKSLEYMMVGYILADEPEIGMMDALRKSKQMMMGHKWDAFVLSLSFLGWELLSVVTLGVLDIFYVRPYVEATFAELYLTLKQS
ncbi:MAG: DUF975 family protein [Faecalibacterium sp.]